MTEKERDQIAAERFATQIVEETLLKQAGAGAGAGLAGIEKHLRAFGYHLTPYGKLAMVGNPDGIQASAILAEEPGYRWDFENWLDDSHSPDLDIGPLGQVLTAVELRDVFRAGRYPALADFLEALRIEPGDYVRRGLEGFVAGMVQEDEVYPFEGGLRSIPIEECKLERKATDEYRDMVIRKLATFPEGDPRRMYAGFIMASQGEKFASERQKRIVSERAIERYKDLKL